jgi:hypothetical protein
MKTQGLIDDSIEICCLLEISELGLRARFVKRIEFLAKFVENLL